MNNHLIMQKFPFMSTESNGSFSRNESFDIQLIHCRLMHISNHTIDQMFKLKTMLYIPYYLPQYIENKNTFIICCIENIVLLKEVSPSQQIPLFQVHYFI